MAVRAAREEDLASVELEKCTTNRPDVKRRVIRNAKDYMRVSQSESEGRWKDVLISGAR